jgi:hypothetical protein
VERKDAKDPVSAMGIDDDEEDDDELIPGNFEGEGAMEYYTGA